MIGVRMSCLSASQLGTGNVKAIMRVFSCAMGELHWRVYLLEVGRWVAHDKVQYDKAHSNRK